MAGILDKYEYDPLVQFAFEQVTVSNASIGFTAATLANAKLAICTLETDQIRTRQDGTAPTSSVGTLYNVADQFIVYGSENLKNFRGIRVTTDATLDVEYYR